MVCRKWFSYRKASQPVRVRQDWCDRHRHGRGWLDSRSQRRPGHVDNDCGGTPCGVDTKYLCRANITRLPKFGTSCTRVETLKCRAKLAKGRPYWVYVEAPMPPNNTEDAWNLSATPTLGRIAESLNDGAWAPAANQPLPAFSVF